MIPNPMQGGTTPYQNPSYPMSRLVGSTYAAPLNYNQPSEVVGGYDARINPMTGEEIAQTNFARGGGVSHAGMASLVQSRGRGDDSVLVHMTPGEVHGLQSLAMAHGGSLTINPETGLYEAGWLKKLLPTIIGGVLTPLTGGLINPATAGMLVGGFEAARTGDLGKGLMAGFGAYSGASLGSSLSKVGTAAAKAAGSAATAVPAAEEAAWNAAASTGGSAAGNAAAEAVRESAASGLAGMKAYGQNVMGGIKALGQPGVAKGIWSNLGRAGQAGLVGTAANLAAREPEPYEEKDPTYYISGGYTTEGGFAPGYYTKEYPGYAGLAAGGNVAEYGSGGNVLAAIMAKAKAKQKETPPQNYNLGEDYTKALENATNPTGKKLNIFEQLAQDANIKNLRETGDVQYIPGGYSAEGGFAPGTYVLRPSDITTAPNPRVAPPTSPRAPAAPSTLGTYSASGESYTGSKAEQLAAYLRNLNASFKSTVPPTQAAIPATPSRDTAYAGGGGITQHHVAGRLVTGDGDGMSDSIRANIDGHQEARLADGEFVIPADVVSHLGNGSTDAGSKKLYSMMDRVRKARTGRTRQAPQISPDRFMSA